MSYLVQVKAGADTVHNIFDMLTARLGALPDEAYTHCKRRESRVVEWNKSLKVTPSSGIGPG